MGRAYAVRTLTDAQFEALLDKLLSIKWPVASDRMPSLAEQWAWPLASEADEEYGFYADPGYGLATNCPADFTPYEGDLSTIVVATSDYVEEPIAAARDALNDAFARHVAIAGRRLGKPARREQGTVPLVAWNLPNGARIVVARSAESGWIEVADPVWAKARRRSDDRSDD